MDHILFLEICDPKQVSVPEHHSSRRMRCLLCLRCVSVTLLTGVAVATVRYFSFWISNSLKIRELLKNVIQNKENVIQTDDYSL